MYLDSQLNIPKSSINWPLDGDPQIKWDAPTSAVPGSYQIWRSTSGNFAGASLLATLDNSQLEYTDASATADGTGYYYWPVAVASNGKFAGQINAVLACQNTLVIAGSMSSGPPTASYVKGIMIFTNDLNHNGTYRSTMNMDADFIAGTPPPSHVNPGSMGGQLGPKIMANPYDYQSAYSLQEVHAPFYSSGSTTVYNSEAEASKTHPYAPFTYPIVMGIGIDPGPAPTVAATGNTTTTGKLSYVSGDATPAFAPTSGGSIGGGSGTPPAPPPAPISRPLPAENFWPTAVPLPCVPCCQTAAPICDCSGDYDAEK